MSVRWRVGLLALAVAASSAAVPTLVGPPPRSSSTAAAAPVGEPPSATTPPAISTLSPAASPTGSTASPTAAPTTPVPSTTPRRPRPSSSSIRFRPITIDAAAKANRGDGIEVTDCVTCLSGRRVQYLGQGHTLVVPVPDVPVAGRRTLTIVYTCACTDEPRRLDLRVNDGDPVSLPLKGAGSWEDPAKTRLRVTLAKGDNQIVFYNVNDPAPDLDRIELT